MTFCPAATLGAPQTICMGSPFPRSTVQTCMWSELGCGRHVWMWPTMSPWSPPLMDCISSTHPTSSPIDVSASATCCAVRLKSTYSFSQLYDIFIVEKWGSSC